MLIKSKLFFLKREIGADGVVTLTIAAHHDSKHGVTFKGIFIYFLLRDDF